MKNNMRSLFKDWRGFLLLEGRRENAAIAIVKKINDPFLRDLLHDFATIADGQRPLASLTGLDPTPNKKYIEWAARRINDYARKEEDDEYLQSLANAQKNPDGFSDVIGNNLYGPEKLKHIQSLSPEQRIQAGYPTNEQRITLKRDDAQVNITNIANKIRNNLPKYHRFAERGLMDKNIDKYKEIYEWEHEIYKAEREHAERERMKTIEKGAKETTDYIHDDDDFMIVRPRSADSSCYYGRGTRWCISASESRNYFDQYTGEGTGFYFVMFKHIPQGDPYKKMALVYTIGESEEPNEVFDAEDDEVGTEALREAVEENIIAAALKNLLNSEMKKLKGDLRQKYFKERLGAVHDTYRDLDALLGGEDEEGETWGEAEASGGPVGSTLAQSKEAKRTWQQLKLVLNKLGLDDESLSVALYEDIQEHITELIDEQYYEILGNSGPHFEENPAGPTGEEYGKIHDNYDLEYIYVSYDEYEEGRWYWNGGFSLSFTDIHDDLENADEDSVENVFRQILDSHYIYPDEIEVHQGEMRVDLQPDHDENQGLNGFESFMSRMEDHDNALKEIFGGDKEDAIEAFKQAGLIAGTAVKTLKERFDNLELENFDIDIEEHELSIYTRLDVVVPIPEHLYKGLTAGVPEWTTANRADISKSPDLQVYDAMLKQRQSEHSDELIQHVQNSFDRAFEMFAKQLQSALPGFEREPPARETTGLLIPDYNVGIYRTAHKTQVGPSGLITSYFFDVRIEADEEESTEEVHLKLIERFLKAIDKKEMIEKIRARLEGIIQDDAIKNIMPEFKEDVQAPTIDPRTGEVSSAQEREEEGVGAGAPIYENKRKLKISLNKKLLKEEVPYGGYGSSLAGSQGANLGTTIEPYELKRDTSLGDDTYVSAKIVLQRNGQVLLIKNDMGWDLPGGHIKESEDIISGLMREVFEETGLSLSSEDIVSLNMKHKNKKFFCGEFGTDDVTLSEEHYEYGFYTLEEILKMDNISKPYKIAIKKCITGDTTAPKLTIKITGHGSPFVGAGPR
jgi:8-oxo-dGTP diphosphatase